MDTGINMILLSSKTFVGDGTTYYLNFYLDRSAGRKFVSLFERRENDPMGNVRLGPEAMVELRKCLGNLISFMSRQESRA
ncbi:MAG: hypothetical protein A2Y38_24610 [Spirochaetes bacterium GWB1_59_5]|nr:MAG: hypothetical protein A2Y38_24610 [Spirochaetes bacterium GWB1_59_5]